MYELNGSGELHWTCCQVCGVTWTDLILLSACCLPPERLRHGDVYRTQWVWRIALDMLPGLLANMDWPDYAIYMLFTPRSSCHGVVYRGEFGEYVVVSSSHIVLARFKAYTLFTPIQGFVF